MLVALALAIAAQAETPRYLYCSVTDARARKFWVSPVSEVALPAAFADRDKRVKALQDAFFKAVSAANPDLNAEAAVCTAWEDEREARRSLSNDRSEVSRFESEVISVDWRP